MLLHNRSVGDLPGDYDGYFGPAIDGDALRYLTLVKRREREEKETNEKWKNEKIEKMNLKEKKRRRKRQRKAKWKNSSWKKIR